MTYSNATYFLDLESGSDAARTALTSVAVANNGAGLVRCTKTAHGLVTGAVGTASLNYAGDWKITVIDANTFDLIGSTYATSTAITFTPFGGSSKADAWLTYTSGATAARIAPGDTIRVKSSTDETSIGNATWTNVSKTVTLAGAVTANVSDCETAWTASANVTTTADTTQFKENTKSMKSVIAGAFTTGKVAYFATGTLDLSGYQQLSFWIKNDIAITAGMLSIRLCTDTAGATSVHTFAIPAKADTTNWAALTIDLATNLNSAIASVALYADTDPGAMTVQLDNIIAVKAASSADSLSLTSLIGKVWNLAWVASATYATNDLRRPTQPNRTGFIYKITAGGGGAAGSTEPTWPVEIGKTVVDGALTWTCSALEETWHPIQSINGTTVKLDASTPTLGNAGQGYAGTTETVATYKRETIKQTMQGSFNNGAIAACVIQDAGTVAAQLTFTGGWNRTDMTTKTGETWVSGQNCNGAMLDASVAFLTLDNLNSTRFSYGINVASAPCLRLTNVHVNGWANYGIACPAQSMYIQNVSLCDGVSSAMNIQVGRLYGSCLTANSIINGFVPTINLDGSGLVDLNYVVVKNNGCTASGVLQTNTGSAPVIIRNLTTANNATSPINDPRGRMVLINPVMGEGTPYAAMTAYAGLYSVAQNFQGTTGSHQLWSDGGTIVSATDQRHTASGISWKFRPTSTTRHSGNPLRLPVSKIACVANSLVTIQIWTRRDSTNIVGTLKVVGGQIAGVPSDVTVACAPTTNTWTLSSALTFTSTEDGVVEITFEVYDGVGTTNNFWIDDLTVT